MIVINAAMQADADTIDAMKQAIAKMETASLAEEGCHDYCFSQELSDPTRMRITERWETMEALAENDIAITQGPVSFGLDGNVSLFVRDPDRNVIELRGREEDLSSIGGVIEYVPGN